MNTSGAGSEEPNREALAGFTRTQNSSPGSHDTSDSFPVHALLQGSQAVGSPTDLVSREIFPDSVTGLPAIPGASGSLGEGSMALNVMNATLNGEGSTGARLRNQDLDLTSATPRDVQIKTQVNDYNRE